MSETPHFDNREQEPKHHQWYDRTINDWWCEDCQNVTDYCKQLNDFGQDVPYRPESDDERAAH